ncbi:reverse transcriptase family protein [Paracoccus sp. NGMCC 1.201697]|uniref:RNA-directed DNA polymerase n=1 Tax=Paracoccus broussonetiae subsp. drimophilus TaxID=3373869 RepID=A0ABW7LM64_9RHOB
MNVDGWRDFYSEYVTGHEKLVDAYLRFIEILQAKGLPPIFEFQHLARLLDVEESLLAAVVRNSTEFYREFSIPKRSGGTRTISVPQPSLLHCQRWVNREILQNLEVSDRAFGFVSGRSVVNNAAEHLGRSFLLNLDILNFFPSINSNLVLNAFLGLGYPPSVSLVLTEICCVDEKLPQGAPTSPALSNYLCKNLDHELEAICNTLDLKYSRYADDMTFSGEIIESDAINKISFIIESFGFKLNKAKTRVSGPHSKKIVTGVSIGTGKMKLPRRTVRTIKSDAHFLKKFGPVEFSKRQTIPDPLAAERLLGRVSFWLQIDPENHIAQSIKADISHTLTTQ